MRLTLVGADVEENLGMGMIAAAATGAGHRVEVLGFNDSARIPDLVRPDHVERARTWSAWRPQFQHRGLDFLALATALRKAGFRGHITAGGHFATMGCAERSGGSLRRGQRGPLRWRRNHRRSARGARSKRGPG